jgi:hypothetical protein
MVWLISRTHPGVFEQEIERFDQAAGNGNNGKLGGLSARTQALVKLLEHRVVPAGVMAAMQSTRRTCGRPC